MSAPSFRLEPTYESQSDANFVRSVVRLGFKKIFSFRISSRSLSISPLKTRMKRCTTAFQICIDDPTAALRSNNDDFLATVFASGDAALAGL